MRKIIMGIFLIVICSQIISAAYSTEKTYTILKTPQTEAKFQIVSLKYEPYPVNDGDWFDIWIKVQNIGQEDAKDATFELKPEFPFSSNDSLIRNYGLIYGSKSAFNFDQKMDSSQVILKYRVKVADNAKEGISNLKLLAGANGNQSATKLQIDLPIEIKKTKTELDVSLRDITDQGISFVVSNIGDNVAKAVDLSVGNIVVGGNPASDLSIGQQDALKYLSGYEPSSLGNLEPGDFVIANQKISVSGQSVTVEVSYTDLAGVRSIFEKTVRLDNLVLPSHPVQETKKTYPNWVYLSIGFLAGCFLVILIGILRRKK